MMYLISLPEVSYVKSDAGLLGRWFPPAGMWFKYQVLEVEDDVSLDSLKSKLLVSDKPVYLTVEEIARYKEKYGNS